MVDVARAEKDLKKREEKKREEKRRTVTGTRNRIPIQIQFSILPLVRKRAARRTERLALRASVPP
jgi:hypothetical protein